MLFSQANVVSTPRKLLGLKKKLTPRKGKKNGVRIIVEHVMSPLYGYAFPGWIGFFLSM